jgi:hypothetical protein
MGKNVANSWTRNWRVDEQKKCKMMERNWQINLGEKTRRLFD